MNKITSGFIYILLLLSAVTFHRNAAAEIHIFFNEDAFKDFAESAGYNLKDENFEGGPWDSVRSTFNNFNAADSITSSGITWRSSEKITTSTGAGRSGYGVYSYPHGIPDRLFGESNETLYGVGGWIDTNSPPAKVNIILDDIRVVDFDDPIIGPGHQFFGLIDTDGFDSFEIREMEGTAGDQKFIFADDFTFAISSSAPNRSPKADPGPDREASPGASVILDATGSTDPEGGALTYFWEQNNGTSVTLSDAFDAQPSFTAPEVGEDGEVLIFKLTVTDPGGLQSSGGVAVYVGRHPVLYFPHIASGSGWESEICAVNKSETQAVTGRLTPFDRTGQPLAGEMELTLAPLGREQIVVGETFTDAGQIAYLVFDADPANLAGYTKFYMGDRFRASVPAVTRINRTDIVIPHVASDDRLWWTGFAFLNPTGQNKTLSIEFDNGQTENLTLMPGEHRALNISDLFDGQSQPRIQSGMIKNASGIIGLLIFGSQTGAQNNETHYLSGILLTDRLETLLYYPHVASDSEFATGIVGFNPSDVDSLLTIRPFSADGTGLDSIEISLAAGDKYVGTADGLRLPPDTAWFGIDSTLQINGFELFVTRDGSQMGGFSAIDFSKRTGIFPKLEREGATGIAFVNTGSSRATVTLSAYDDNGTLVARHAASLDPREKAVGVAEDFFPVDISSATYIRYESDQDVAGFQLNASAGAMMLDGLESL